MKKIITIFLWLIVGIGTFNAYGFITLNDIECSFIPDPEKALLKENVVKGSSNFLEGFSKVNMLLKLYEDSSLSNKFDSATALTIINETISCLNLANMHYSQAKLIGERLGYDETKISLFKNFSYSFYANKMNPSISSKVTNYLSQGDILGIYQYYITKINEVGYTLKEIQIEIQLQTTNQIPDINKFWTLLQTFSETAIFGNYATILGHNVLSNCPK